MSSSTLQKHSPRETLVGGEGKGTETSNGSLNCHSTTTHKLEQVLCQKSGLKIKQAMAVNTDSTQHVPLVPRPVCCLPQILQNQIYRDVVPVPGLYSPQ